MQFCLTILHGQGQTEKKALKVQHAALVEKKTALRSALCAARGTVTKFDTIASFWQEFVLETEEKERMENRRTRLARAAAGNTWTTGKLTKSKSCILAIGGKSESALEHESSRMSQSSLSSCLLLLGELHKQADCADKARSDRRCGSVGDRKASLSECGFEGKPLFMPAKPKPEPIEINVDLERILPPVEGDAVCATTAAIAAV